MGVGGGFIMVPAMIYLLGMPTKVVVGTSLFQIIFVTAFATLLHATTNFTVDMVLAVLLLIGGVIGAQIGARLGVKLKAEYLRILLAIMVLGVCGKLATELLFQPDECSPSARQVGIETAPVHTGAVLMPSPPRRGGGRRRAEPERGVDHREFQRLRDPDLRGGATLHPVARPARCK